MSTPHIPSLARRVVAATLAAALAFAPAVRPAAAQSTLHAQCVGGVFGCTQVDFFYTVAPSMAPLTATSFLLALTSPAWVLSPTAAQAAGGEAEDTFGPLFFTPAVVGQVLTQVY